MRYQRYASVNNNMFEKIYRRHLVFRDIAIRILNLTPFVKKLLRPLLIKIRVRRESKIIELCNLYPKDKEFIIEDYMYSIKVTHRGILQVINIETAIRYIEDQNIKGAFVETGTYTGGASAYALRALLRISSKELRDYWGFDSFEGMPSPTIEDGDHGSIWIYKKPMNKISLVEGKAILKGHDVNHADYAECLSYLRDTGYPSQRINLVKGWFQNTLPQFKQRIGPIAILRLDGDFYESTKIVFDELYDQVVQGGLVIVDDYGAFQGCRKATDEFLKKIKSNIHIIYVEDSIRYFFKP